MMRNRRRTGRIPSAKDLPPLLRLLLDLPDHLHDLIHPFPLVILVAPSILRPKVPPLVPVNGPQVAFIELLQTSTVEVVARTERVPKVDPAKVKAREGSRAREYPEEFLRDEAEG
jgi:hypothetical protein